MQSRLERLEEAEKRHRDQLRNERLKREEAERRLYTDRQGSIKKNIRSIMVMSPSPSTPLRSGTGAGEEAQDSALPQQQHLRKCLTEAEGAIQKLECDLLRELDARQQLERAVSNSNSNGNNYNSPRCFHRLQKRADSNGNDNGNTYKHQNPHPQPQHLNPCTLTLAP